MAYCRWYEKDLREVAEYEQENCNENGQMCDKCPYLVIEEVGRWEENA